VPAPSGVGETPAAACGGRKKTMPFSHHERVLLPSTITGAGLSRLLYVCAPSSSVGVRLPGTLLFSPFSGSESSLGFAVLLAPNFRKRVCDAEQPPLLPLPPPPHVRASLVD